MKPGSKEKNNVEESIVKLALDENMVGDLIVRLITIVTSSLGIITASHFVSTSVREGKVDSRARTRFLDALSPQISD